LNDFVEERRGRERDEEKGRAERRRDKSGRQQQPPKNVFLGPYFTIRIFITIILEEVSPFLIPRRRKRRNREKKRESSSSVAWVLEARQMEQVE
jgi:hypothetical protein